jgi:hypothetical protein
MLFRKPLWPHLADGSVTVAFRCWRRPTVKAGGTLTTAVGVLAVDRVDVIDPADITMADARRAGYNSVDEVLREWSHYDDAGRRLYRIEFHHIGADPRVALRERSDLGGHEFDEIVTRLEGLDRRSDDGPWTRQVLELIARQPAVRAPDLAAQAGQETPRFKRRVRRLKELGLTESLEVGYRLSPRGTALLDRLR